MRRGALWRLFYRASLADHSYKFLFKPGPAGEAVSLDCETTGLDPGVDDVLTVAAVRVRGDRILLSERTTPPEAVAEFFGVDWTSRARRHLDVPVLHLLKHETFAEQADGAGEGDGKWFDADGRTERRGQLAQARVGQVERRALLEHRRVLADLEVRAAGRGRPGVARPGRAFAPGCFVLVVILAVGRIVGGNLLFL